MSTRAGLAFLVRLKRGRVHPHRKNLAFGLSFRKRRSSWTSKWRRSRCRRRVRQTFGCIRISAGQDCNRPSWKGHSGYDATLSQTTIEHQESVQDPRARRLSTLASTGWAVAGEVVRCSQIRACAASYQCSGCRKREQRVEYWLSSIHWLHATVVQQQGSSSNGRRECNPVHCASMAR